MNGWRVVYKDANTGAITESDEIEFPGGRAEIITWFQDKECHGKLLSYVSDPVRKCLEKVKIEVPTLIQSHFQLMSDNLATLEKMDECTEAVNEMLLFFKKPPNVQLDVKQYVDKTCTFDVMKITYRQETSKCVIVNKNFRVEVYNIFKSTFEAVGKELKTLIMADLTATLDVFSETAKRETENADAIYARNVKMLEDKLSIEGKDVYFPPFIYDLNVFNLYLHYLLMIKQR